MSRLYEYIQRGRGDEISEDKALELLRKNCSKSLKAWQKNSGYYITRNTPKSGSYYYVNPAKSSEPRVSRNTKNYYTIIIDNSPLWKQYPKRSESLICMSGNLQRMFYMFPYDGVKIGVCPESDIWKSWNNIFVRLHLLNTDIWNMFVNANIKFKIDMTKLKDFKNACKGFDKAYEKKGYDDAPYWFNKNYSGDLYKILEKLLSPKTDNFKLLKSGDKLPDFKEVWFSGECIMIRDISDLVGILKNE